MYDKDDKGLDPKHEWDMHVLERTLRSASTRLALLVALAVPAAILGVAGLVKGGSGPIWGLALMMVAAIALAFALRQKTKRDYCRSQLDRIERRDGNTPPQPPAGTA